MRLILINGKPGTGKSSVSRKLLGMLPEPAAWIDTDDLMRVRPFHKEQTFTEALQRGLRLAEDFYERGYAHVILTGCVHAPELADAVRTHPTLSACDITYVLLAASPEVSETRKRAQGYSEKKHATMFDIIKSGNLDLTADDVRPWTWMTVNTDAQEPEEIARQIASRSTNA